MKWKTLDSKYAIDTKFLKVRQDCVELPNGIADDWELLFTNYDYPTKDINQVNIYLARDIQKVSEQKLDISEDIKYYFAPLKEAVEMYMNQSICVNGTIAGILKVARIYGL